MNDKQPLGITELVLRDSHQSLFATRLRIDDMLPIAEKLDQVGYWSLESWGGATFDACIRFLGEDPWDRIRELKKVMPKTPQQMLFRAQNILGYRHYADDIVEKFVERAAANGVDVFRIFDAMNDVRNLSTAIGAAVKQDKHAQAALSYTVSPVHTIDTWLDMSKRVEDLGAHSICIKDMAGLLAPYVAFELVSRLKQTVDIPIHLHCHATTGMSTATLVKAIEAGADNVDTAISSMSMTYGHSPTESLVSILAGGDRDTGLDILELEEIAAYFREVRKKYAKFEGALKGVDSRILVAQVPGGMLTNLESQLREQNATDRLDDVLEEIPKVREDLGFIPLVTPTSQIVGTQAVLNVLTGERYKTVTKETEGVLKGGYGATPAAVNAELQSRVLAGEEPITCRPADKIEPEFDRLKDELTALAKEQNFEVADEIADDVLIYALFPQVGLNFLNNRNNPDAFEPKPGIEAPVAAKPAAAASTVASDGIYTVEVDGQSYSVKVSSGGEVQSVAASAAAPVAAATSRSAVTAPLAGNIFKVNVGPGDQVSAGDIVVVLEAMKMETEIRAVKAGRVEEVLVKVGDKVSLGDALVSMS
jgi:oxaloacetate decarboxylase alpha subunit